jgi:hypothetical protein
VLLSGGLLLGLLMSLYAFVPMVTVPAALDRYDDLPRRLLRLAHIAALMLPLINVVLGPWLDRLRLSPGWKQASSWLLLTGAVALPFALTVSALVPAAASAHLSAVPALAFCAGVAIASAGALRTPRGDLFG